MTDKEIIKALEDSIERCYVAAPILGMKFKREDNLLQYAIDLINHQQAEIEELREHNHKIAMARVEEVQYLPILRTEAIKEVILQLDAEVESSDKYIREYDDSEEQKAYNQGLRNARMIVKRMIDEEVKSGVWERTENGTYRCSVCHHKPIENSGGYLALTPYCPFCGVAMDV